MYKFFYKSNERRHQPNFLDSKRRNITMCSGGDNGLPGNS